MRALAVEPASLFNEDYRNRHALASTSTVNTALRRLLADSTIEYDAGAYRLANPLLAHHLARQQTANCPVCLNMIQYKAYGKNRIGNFRIPNQLKNEESVQVRQRSVWLSIL